MAKATTYRSCSLDTFRQRRLWQRKRRIEKARWGGVNASPAHCVARVVKTAEIVACLSVHRDASLPTGINTRRQESAFPYSIIINLTRWHYSLGCRKMRWRRPKTTNRKKKNKKTKKTSRFVRHSTRCYDALRTNASAVTGKRVLGLHLVFILHSLRSWLLLATSRALYC